jgi:heme/copper-type cytochrome/quinol oxidase subunit 1
MTTTHPTATTADDVATRDHGAAGASGAASGLVEATSGWLTSTDHKRIGRLFIGGGLLAALATAALGVLLGIERVDGTDPAFDAGAIPQMFSAYHVALVFGAGMPLLLGLAIAAVPLQVGARALAFPRLAMGGLWIWAIGLTLVVIALANNGGPGGGNRDMVDLFLVAHGLLLVGLAAAAMSVATTVLTTRAPGMRMSRVPAFAWSALIASLALLLMLPVLLGTVIYLYVDHSHGNAAFGGNTAIGALMKFAYTQPAIYVLAIPSAGLLAELFAVTFGRRLPIRGAVYTGIALIGISGLAATTQQPSFIVSWAGDELSFDDFGETFDTLVPWALFLLLPLLGVVVTLGSAGMVVRGGRTRLRAPFVLALLGVLIVLAGMIGGAMYPISDLGLIGTVFEEGATVAVVYGSVLAALGGIAYWTPKWWGRTMPDLPLYGLALLGFGGAALASLPYFIAGFADQPLDQVVYDYSGPSELWNVLALTGHVLVFVTVLGFVALLAKAIRGEGDVDDDPWGGHTLEWATTSPAPADNFAEPPTVASPEPLLDLAAGPDPHDRAADGDRADSDGSTT